MRAAAELVTKLQPAATVAGYAALIQIGGLAHGLDRVTTVWTTNGDVLEWTK